MGPGYKDKVPDDIALVINPGIENGDLVNAVQQLVKLQAEKPKSIVVEVKTYRKYVPILVKAYIAMSEGLDKAIMQANRYTEIDYDRGNKRWTREEDETLIEIVCDGESNIHEISTIFGRSPGAIKTHISELVGRRRLTQDVAGKFIGTINGESAEAIICGTVHKD